MSRRTKNKPIEPDKHSRRYHTHLTHIENRCIAQKFLFYLCYKVFKIKPYYLLLLLLIAGTGYGCLKSDKPGIPESVRRVIDASGIHKVEFLQAMVSYEAMDDSLKLRSLYYLIANMGCQYEIDYKITDSTGKKYFFPLKDYPDYSTLQKHLRLLKTKTGPLIIDHDTILLDIKTVDASLLKTNIDTAFRSWQHPVYKQNIYSFNDFCKYILPYRVANEKAESFRHFIRSRYHEKIFSVLRHTPINLLSLIGRVHQVVTSDIGFDKRYELHYNYPTLREITKSHRGNYRDIAIYEVKAFRSFGIASTMDYTPYFADSSGGYFWPVVQVSDNQFIPVFYPGISIDNLTLPGKIPKVYRRKYSDDSSSLFRIKKVSEHTPAFLGQFNYDDVTDEYIKTSDLKIPITDTARYAYLAVFNSGAWHPVQWSFSNYHDTALFTKMGVDIVYLPMIIKKEQTVPAGLPFLLQKNGKIRLLQNQITKPKSNATLSKTDPYHILQPHKNYFIYQWKNNRWQIIRLLKSDFRGTVNLKLQPSTLYILSKENAPEWFSTERPFMIHGTSIIYY